MGNNVSESDHQKCYFYCPECRYEEILDSLPKDSITNFRGGYGRPVHHSKCPKCHFLNAGCMYFNGKDLSEDEKFNIQIIINLYYKWRDERWIRK